MHACALVTSYLLVPPPPRVPHRSNAASMGLLDWMLADAYKPPIEQFCRPEGWDCDLLLRSDVVSQDKGPMTVSANLNVGLRFRADGVVSLVQPSRHFAAAATKGTWHAVEMAKDYPSIVRWRLQTGEDGVRDATGTTSIVAPHTDLLGTFRLEPESATLLCAGELWLEQTPEAGEALRAIGTCDASPMPLMGAA